MYMSGWAFLLLLVGTLVAAPVAVVRLSRLLLHRHYRLHPAASSAGATAALALYSAGLLGVTIAGPLGSVDDDMGLGLLSLFAFVGAIVVGIISVVLGIKALTLQVVRGGEAASKKVAIASVGTGVAVLLAMTLLLVAAMNAG